MDCPGAVHVPAPAGPLPAETAPPCNTNRHDLAVEFVHWNSLSEEDRANYQQISAIIKDKIVVQPVSNANLLKPGDVIRAVETKTGIKISQNDHTLLWKAFRVRPAASSEAKFDTVSNANLLKPGDCHPGASRPAGGEPVQGDTVREGGIIKKQTEFPAVRGLRLFSLKKPSFVISNA